MVPNLIDLFGNLVSTGSQDELWSNSNELASGLNSIIGNLAGIASSSSGIMQGLVDNVCGPRVNPVESVGISAGFVDKVASRFYGLICYKMCIKSIDRCLQKADQLIQHWEDAFNQTCSTRVEIDQELKMLCRGRYLHEEFDLGDFGKVKTQISKGHQGCRLS